MRFTIYFFLLFFSISTYACPPDIFCPNDRVLYTQHTNDGSVNYTLATVVQFYDNGVVGVLFPGKPFAITVSTADLSKVVASGQNQRVLFDDGEVATLIEIYSNDVAYVRADHQGYMFVPTNSYYTSGCLNGICRGRVVTDVPHHQVGMALEVFMNGKVLFRNQFYPVPYLIPIEDVSARLY
mgnify:CR=1 FL=1